MDTIGAGQGALTIGVGGAFGGGAGVQASGGQLTGAGRQSTLAFLLQRHPKLLLRIRPRKRLPRITCLVDRACMASPVVARTGQVIGITRLLSTADSVGMTFSGLSGRQTRWREKGAFGNLATQNGKHPRGISSGVLWALTGVHRL